MAEPDPTPFERSKPGPVPWLPVPLSRLMTHLYTREVARRNHAWDRGRGVVTLDRPVISVGNLSVGGTGKTPTVTTVVRWLLEAGCRPAIAMRGYKQSHGLSDEAAEYADHFGERVPVVAQPDRVEGLMRLFAEVGHGVDCVVLDDGFQHRRLARQLDIVLVDASREPFSDACLPSGWLREPVGSLARADVVVLTHAELSSADALDRIRRGIRAETNAPVCLTTHHWDGLEVLLDGESCERPSEWLEGKRVCAACAIGNPGAFLAAARRAAGGALAGELVLRDHHGFDEATVRRLLAMAEECDAILVTGKDWTKLSRIATDRWPCPVARPRLTMGFVEGESMLRGLVLGCAGGASPSPDRLGK